MKNDQAKRPSIDYNEEQINLAVEIYDKVERKLDFLLYIQEQRDTKLSLILIETTIKNFEKYIIEGKRDTDLFITVDKEKGIYLVVCQETDVHEGYQFLERVMKPFHEMEHVCSCAALLSIKAYNSMTTKKILFRLLDDFIKLTSQPKEWKKCQISHKSI